MIPDGRIPFAPSKEQLPGTSEPIRNTANSSWESPSILAKVQARSPIVQFEQRRSSIRG
jgi:hypothetical protein